MKRFPFLTALGITAAIFVAGVSHARDGERPDFATMDADGDGQISQAEMLAHREARFTQNDTNGDGYLDRDEMVAAAHKRAETRVDRMLSRMDSDKNGMLSLDELGPQGNPGMMMSRFDSDGSGTLSKAEFEAAGEMMRARHGMGHSGRGSGRESH